MIARGLLAFESVQRMEHIECMVLHGILGMRKFLLKEPKRSMIVSNSLGVMLGLTRIQSFIIILQFPHSYFYSIQPLSLERNNLDEYLPGNSMALCSSSAH